MALSFSMRKASRLLPAGAMCDPELYQEFPFAARSSKPAENASF
jgi:hypothetical protein